MSNSIVNMDWESWGNSGKALYALGRSDGPQWETSTVTAGNNFEDSEARLMGQLVLIVDESTSQVLIKELYTCRMKVCILNVLDTLGFSSNRNGAGRVLFRA